MSNIEIREENGKIYTYTPYNADFVVEAKKNLSGKWDPSKKAWYFDPRNRGMVEKAIEQVYGVNLANQGDTVTIRVDFANLKDHAVGREFLIGGITIVRKISRDVYPVIAENAVLESGTFYNRGGSCAHPSIEWDEDNAPVMLIHDIPRVVAEKEGWEIVEDEIDREALEAEKKKLLARIAEIDALLGK